MPANALVKTPDKAKPSTRNGKQQQGGQENTPTAKARDQCACYRRAYGEGEAGQRPDQFGQQLHIGRVDERVLNLRQHQAGRKQADGWKQAAGQQSRHPYLWQHGAFIPLAHHRFSPASWPFGAMAFQKDVGRSIQPPLRAKTPCV